MPSPIDTAHFPQPALTAEEVALLMETSIENVTSLQEDGVLRGVPHFWNGENGYRFLLQDVRSLQEREQ